jgi:hypothetical protein
LQLIIQIHTCGGYLSNGEYIYCSSDAVADHVQSFHEQVLSALEMKPILINCHSGVDCWNEEQAVSYFQQVLALEVELNTTVKIVHETHRQRLLYSPFQAKTLLSNPLLQNLKINADLSHWVCVCERVFNPSEPRDRWWSDLLRLVADHCHMIHARVGYAEGPQIPDPRATIWSHEVNSHLLWWETIWTSLESAEDRLLIIEPEHGPTPYQIYSDICPDHTLLSTRGDSVAVATESMEEAESVLRDEILWAINNYVAERVRDRWSESRKKSQNN